MPVTNEQKHTRARLVSILLLCGSVVCIAMLVGSGFGVKFGLWNFRLGFLVLKISAYGGLVYVLLSALIGYFYWKKRHLAAAAICLAALLVGAAAFAVPFSWMLKARQLPRIHDISTDLNNPPQFVAVAPLRGGAPLAAGAEVAAEQLKGYPDLKTTVVDAPMPKVFQKALEVAQELGWKIVAQEPLEGRIEATDTTFWYGFKDDVVIRVVAAGNRSLVDVRSVSRVGISDVGTNAQRIRKFLARLTPKPGK
jgi:hypothetical protein